MRIIGYIEYPGIKATVFKMDNRLSVKFETGLYEQTYKFREGEGIETLEAAQAFVDEGFCRSVLGQFQQMHRLRNLRLAEVHSGERQDDDLEEII
jgi:hypothetical protein